MIASFVNALLLHQLIIIIFLNRSDRLASFIRFMSLELFDHFLLGFRWPIPMHHSTSLNHARQLALNLQWEYEALILFTQLEQVLRLFQLQSMLSHARLDCLAGNFSSLFEDSIYIFSIYQYPLLSLRFLLNQQ